MVDDETARRLREAFHGNQGAALFAPPPAGASPQSVAVEEPRTAAQFCTDGRRRRFDNERVALDQLARIQDCPPEQVRDYTPTMVRECRKCGGWHLTSKSGKRWARGKSSREIRTARRAR